MSIGSNDDYEVLSQRDVAKMLGVSVSTVQRLRKHSATFPGRKRFSFHTKGWVRHEIKAWADNASSA